MTKSLTFNHLEFTYPGSPDPVFSDVTLQLYPGWTAITGPNGAGKTTLIKLLCEKSGLHAVYVEQRTDDAPEGFAAFLNATDGEAFKLREILGLQREWADRWQTLSHGERKRAQIGAALYQRPDLLAVDEPTNHLDSAARAFVADALQRFRGFGLLISHDRALLDALCGHTIMMAHGEVQMRRQGYATAREERQKEEVFATTQYERQSRAIKKLEKQVDRQRLKIEADKKRLSKSRVDPKDTDKKTRIDLAILTGKDAIEGRILNRTQSRLKHAEAALGEKRPVYETGIALEAQSCPGLFPLAVDEKHLLREGDRIGIVGPNGSGKSTFVKKLAESCDAKAPAVLYLPQEITADESAALLAQIKAAKPDEKGFLMSLFVRLGGDAKSLLESAVPSPGETRKLMLALGLTRKPALIIMDEPTNHLDIVSIEALEKALIDYAGTLVLVSHDERFLANTVAEIWRF